MAGIDDIIGGWIRDAEKSGAVKDLPGYGQPLNLEDDQHIPPKYRMAFRVLKNAGFAPPEVQLFQEIAALKERLVAEHSDDERAAIQTEINAAQQKLDVALDKFKSRS